MPSDERLLRLPALLDRVGLSKPTVYRMIRRGEFPAPAKIGHMSVWSANKVGQWMEGVVG